ncbi:HD-GYP domain-containing protein [Desulfoscipio geothermicus]|uniref:HDIG domain-containing protein n=1 Tax=Desulfoscipio geothermicus DSM 3669 TaxID=1121426 RepID=A0A1I6DBP3_9FIRM|nr:HD domain-containing phosphohydrolase [Desulfoscipio geothermicus]SFR02828.1 HDIG domain-containing protein [Desulfoscipio geothermicus DSM 3669]
MAKSDKSRIDELEALLNITSVLHSTLDLEEAITIVLDQVMNLFGAEAGTLWLLTDERDAVIPLVARGPKADSLRGLKLKRGEGLAGQVIETRQPVLVEDVTKDARWAGRFDSDTGFVTRSMLVVPLIAKEGRVMGSLQLINKKTGELFHQNDLRLCMAVADQAGTIIHNSRLYTYQSKLLPSVIKSINAAVDARTPYTINHSYKVSRYSVLLAEKLGLEGEDLETVERAALFHDIGKINLPDRVLNALGPLDEKGWRLMKRHPAIGAKIIYQMEPKPMLRQVWAGTLYHHERYDGTGYPAGLKGEDIPRVARIIAVADAFDAMTSERPYRVALSFHQAAEELIKHAGTQFDPELAHIFARIVRSEPEKIRDILLHL